jgi:hypothetical protein
MNAARTPDQVLDLLVEAAETGPDKYSQRPSFLIWLMAWPEHTPESLTEAWTVFRDAVRDRNALDPADQDALDAKSAEIDNAYSVLVKGPRGGAL